MKKIYVILVLVFITTHTFSQKEIKKRDTLLLQPIEIKAVRAGDKAPFTKTNLSKYEIEKINLGQDLPFILNQIPSVVVNSDAGNGVGYTGIHIRGTDATRINMTLNGIPYNDAESQGIYFVDLPDIVSSVNNIQVQRGVGTSSNGAGAFGATLNLSTNEINDSMYEEINNSFGSFNTWKHTLKFGSGLMAKHFTIDARVSSITSDGFIDRAKSDLKSFYASAAYLSSANSLRLNIFSGKEKTYQAWYGVPEIYLDTNRTYNAAGTEKSGSPYENQTDNYWQTHYQLFYNHKINAEWAFNTAVFLTRGYGYYEQYKAAQKFASYGLPDYNNGTTIIKKTDLIRQLWLDNNFYGAIFSLQQQTAASQFTLGGGWNQYDGKHYGIVTWANVGFPKDYRFYFHTAHKQDLNVYTKLQQQLSQHWQAFGDVQLRNVKYLINGFRHNPQLLINKNYLFANPKFGITYNKNNYQAYISYSMAGKEPNRDDFEAGINQQPKAEILHDVELGSEKKTLNYAYGVTFYYMYYRNQLVLTGKINDVGEYTRTNTPSSYRAGVELQGKAKLTSWANVAANIAFSKNKIENFTEYVDDYDNGGQKTFEYHNTDISFSPNIVAAGTVSFLPVKHGEISFISKYVGREFLDNTSKVSRSLNPFYTQDARVSYTLNNKIPKEINFIFQVNNIFNRKYEPNGYTFSYFYNGSLATENFYFPMAGVNFMAAVNIKF
ncbi:MAG: TonB-dependent receptor plug domain-containing protein [Bacteroidota bacterium]|nr:TonB-dependent receptor plug domain-containing protein [Bacteroidota bacterium]